MIDANKTIAPHEKKHAFAMSLGHLGTSHCVSPGREGGWRIFFVGGFPGFEGEKRERRGRESHKEYYRAIEEIW